MLNQKLFQRIEDLYERREKLELADEQARLLELRYTWFVRAGAELGAKARKRVSPRSTSGLRAGHRNFAERAEGRAVVAAGAGGRSRPRGPAGGRARCGGADGGGSEIAGKHVITLSRSSVEPFLQFSARRDLREEAFNAWIRRGEIGGKTDNRAIVAEIVALRAELAKLLGYRTYAEYSLEDTMAKTPDAVRGLLIRCGRRP